jgi:anti-anti-sigma factor
MEVKVLKVEKESVCTLHVSGVLDYSTMGTFIEEIHTIKAGTKKVVIDFEGLDFIDSTGIGAIINLVHEANERKFKVELAGINAENQILFEMIGVFEIIESLQMEG